MVSVVINIGKQARVRGDYDIAHWVSSRIFPADRDSEIRFILANSLRLNPRADLFISHHVAGIAPYLGY